MEPKREDTTRLKVKQKYKGTIYGHTKGNYLIYLFPGIYYTPPSTGMA